MSNETKDYAGGWITEKKGTDVPPFLKLAFPIIGLGAIAYIVIYMNGEISHAERGPLVRQMNSATGSSDLFMYVVAGLAAAFVLTVLAFTYSKPHE
jgi:uncharacterized membrane protein YuzA (DUF378 family)